MPSFTNLFREKRNRFYVFHVLENTINNLGNPGGIVFTSMFLYLALDESQIATLMSLAGLTTLLQIFSTLIYQKTTHKRRVILTFYFIRTFALFTIGLTPFFFDTGQIFPILFMLMLVRFGFLHLIGAGVAEWVDSYVPEGLKGRYYGRRNAMLNAGFIFTSFVIGQILDRFPPSDTLYLSFLTAAAVLYFFEWLILIRIPIIKKASRKTLNLKEIFSMPLHDRQYRRFIGFSILWMFANSLGRPLMNVYAVKYMDYTYSIIAITASTTAFIKVFSGIWFGHLLDRKSITYVVTLCGIGFGIFSLMFIFMMPESPVIYIISTVGLGIFMIGFNVAKFRLNVKLAQGEHMNVYISGNAFFIGLATFLSVYLSGLIIDIFKGFDLMIGTIHLNPYQLLFFASGTLHLIAVYYFVRLLGDKDDTGETQL